jgi:hypothetical protein
VACAPDCRREKDMSRAAGRGNRFLHIAPWPNVAKWRRSRRRLAFGPAQVAFLKLRPLLLEPV